MVTIATFNEPAKAKHLKDRLQQSGVKADVHNHVFLAFVILPLVIITLVPVFRRRWDKHRRLGRWTMPVWLYVSITGVLVYFMLYQWFPPASAAAWVP